MLNHVEKIHAANRLYGKYTIMTFLILTAVFIFGCTSAGPSKKQVADAMQGFVLSDDNPLVNSYENFDYQLEKSDTDEKEFFATYQLTEKTKLSEVILLLSTEWHKYDQGWEIVGIEIEEAKARPFNGPNNDELSEAVFTVLPSIYQSTSQSIDLLSQDWEIGDNIIQVEVRISSEFTTFNDITENSLELKWDLNDEQWDYSKLISFKEEINFEGINGTWEGEYDQGPVIFQISDVGTFVCNDNGSEAFDFILYHNLNDVGIDAKKSGYAIGAYENGFMIDLANGFELSTRGLLIGTDGISFEMDGNSTPLERVSDVKIVETRHAYLEDSHMTSHIDDKGMPVDSMSFVSSTGTWYVSSILRDTQTDTIIHYVWYDTNGEVVDTYDLDPQGAKDIYIFGSFELASVAPSGQYKVEIYVSDSSEPSAVVKFAVK